MIHFRHQHTSKTIAEVVHCSETGFHCGGIARADSDEDVMHLTAQHAPEVHRLKEIAPESADKVESAIHEADAAPA